MKQLVTFSSFSHLLLIILGEAIPFAVLDLWQASGKVSEKGGEYDYFEPQIEEGEERRKYKEEINTVGPLPILLFYLCSLSLILTLSHF